jgi:hypothetical protein
MYSSEHFEKVAKVNFANSGFIRNTDHDRQAARLVHTRAVIHLSYIMYQPKWKKGEN